VAASDAPHSWRLLDETGQVQLEGKSLVFGNDRASGQRLHHIDFSAWREPGTGYVLASGCAESHPFDIASRLFDSLPYDALAYFYHNRSSIPIVAKLAGDAEFARPAGHPVEKVSCLAGEDAHENDWPGCDYTLDVSGGWYDAGDHGKYVVNGGIAVWTLLNLYERQGVRSLPDLFGDGQAAIPEADNGVSDLLDEARYELEFLLRMQAPDGATAQVPVDVKRNAPGVAFTRIDAGGMAHHKMSDRNWTPVPTPPHLDREERVLFPVSTAATLNLAATAAQCARIWKSFDADFAARCLTAAERAWAAATRNPEVYFIADFQGSGMYGDGELSDEFFWAAAELFVTTGGARYREFIEESPYLAGPEREASWGYVAPLGLVSLAAIPNSFGESGVRDLRSRIVTLADAFVDERGRSGYRLPFASDRYVWGSNSVLLNRAMLLAYAQDFTGDDRYRDAVQDVMDYLLGRNPLGVSFVSGYGDRSMENPHHRFWAPSADSRLPGPPPGALSGGPNNTAMVDPVAQELKGECAALLCWKDDIEAYALNEVAINWNAPLVWVARYLYQ
jgi:endoglucanase